MTPRVMRIRILELSEFKLAPMKLYYSPAVWGAAFDLPDPVGCFVSLN